MEDLLWWWWLRVGGSRECPPPGDLLFLIGKQNENELQDWPLYFRKPTTSGGVTEFHWVSLFEGG